MEKLEKGRGAGMRCLNIFTKSVLTGMFTLAVMVFMGVGWFGPQEALAATKYSRASTAWATASTWSDTACGGAAATAAPATGDAVIICTGNAVTVGAITQTAAGSVTINGGTLSATTASITFGSLTISSGTLTTSRILTVLGATNITGTISMTTARAHVFADVTLNSGANWNSSGVNNTPTISGSFTNNATTFTPGNGVYTFSGASKTFSGSTATAIPSVTITGSYTNTGIFTINTALTGAGSLTNSGTLNIGGTSTITTLTASAVGNTVNYTGAAQAVKAATYYNLTFAGSGAKTMPAATSVTGTLSIPAAGATAAVTGTNLSVANLTLGGLGRLNGTWGSTASGATTKNSTYFGTSATGTINVTNDTRTASSITGSPTGSAITYGAALSTSTLSGGSGSPVGGTFSWTTPATILDAGTTTAPVIYTPTDPTSYTTPTGSGTITVNKATPTLTVANTPVTYDGTAKSATVNGSVPGSASNILTGGEATQTNAGNYAVTADFTPNDTTNYNSLAAASAGFYVIDKAAQTIGTITFTPATLAVNGTTIASATATSDLTVNFSSNTESICTVSGSTVTGVSAGTCSITAIQTGNGNYNAAPEVTQTLEVIASTNVTLTLTTAGAGGGTVISAPGNIACTRDNGIESGTCSDATFANPTDVTLTAAPDWKSEVVWTGGCSATGNECGPFTLTANTGVTATFTHKQQVMMPGPSYFASIQDAYNAATGGEALKLRSQIFNESLLFDIAKDVTLDGGCDATWNPVVDGMTGVIGSVTIAAGSVTVNNLSII